MKNKFAVGNLVRFNDLICKVVEIWDVAFFASVTGILLNENEYVLTNTPNRKVFLVKESEISGIDAPGTEKTEEIVKAPTKSKK